MIVGRRRGEEKMRIGGGTRWAGRTDERTEGTMMLTSAALGVGLARVEMHVRRI